MTIRPAALFVSLLALGASYPLSARAECVPLAASFEASCSGFSCWFTDTTSLYTCNGTASRTWSFGDGTSQGYAPPNVFHWYDATGPGAYTVTLTVVDTAGTTSTATQVINIAAPSLTLTGEVVRSGKRLYAVLSWTGSTSIDIEYLELYQDGVWLKWIQNSSPESVQVSTKGTHTFKVCEGDYCSNTVTLKF